MVGDKKIVLFELYCPKCEFHDKSASSEPCNSCLSIPGRVDSHKPEKFVERMSRNE